MYDSVRRIVPEYFSRGRSEEVLERAERVVADKHFANEDFNETWHKSNRVALQNLRALKVPGEFQNVHVKRTFVIVGRVRVLSTVDFFASYVPKSANGRKKQVGVIVNPSGIKRSVDKRKNWIAIESEVAVRAAAEHGVEIDEVWYVDLAKNEIIKHTGPKKTVGAEIDATCERIYRDWRDLRLEASQREVGRA